LAVLFASMWWKVCWWQPYLGLQPKYANVHPFSALLPSNLSSSVPWSRIHGRCRRHRHPRQFFWCSGVLTTSGAISAVRKGSLVTSCRLFPNRLHRYYCSTFYVFPKMAPRSLRVVNAKWTMASVTARRRGNSFRFPYQSFVLGIDLYFLPVAICEGLIPFMYIYLSWFLLILEVLVILLTEL
jgi:hypothetical protein